MCNLNPWWAGIRNLHGLASWVTLLLVQYLGVLTKASVWEQLCVCVCVCVRARMPCWVISGLNPIMAFTYAQSEHQIIIELENI